MPGRFIVSAVLPLALSAMTSAPAGTPPDCQPGRGPSGPALLAQAMRATGMRPGLVLRISAWRSQLQDYQSDRTYEPFFSAFSSFDAWFSVSAGTERTAQTGFAFLGSAQTGGPVLLSSARSTWLVRDTTMRPLPPFHARAVASRPLNPWAVLLDFRTGDARFIGRCIYRDYPRYGVERAGPLGAERLLLDVKTHVPVALLRTEPHPTWGQVQVEYVWSNWDRVTAGVLYPLSSFRVVNGRTEISQSVTAHALARADSVPPMAVPDTALGMPATTTVFDQPTPPDTVRAGTDTWLLRSREYTTAVTLRRDTVFVLDATLSEARARLDQQWVASLFPGSHPVVLVVTDLAWPHIGGVRSWVARGAIIASHRVSRAFLDSIVARRWTLAPDELERRRARSRFVFRPVDDSLSLAGGDVMLHAIDGISSEGALLAWVAGDRFLWAGDFVQNLSEPTEYGREVLDAATRAGLRPDRFGAQHLGLVPWERLTSLFAADDAGAAPAEGPGR